MDRHGTLDRRLFLKRMAGAGAGLLVLACQQTPAAPTAAPKAAAEPTAPAAAPAAQAAPASKTALAPMKIGLQANVLAVPTKVAVEAGVFDKYGLKVEPIKFEAAGNIVRDAIMGDQVQAGTFFVATFVVGAATGRVAAFMTSHNVARGTGVIARPDIKTVADLKGKRIGGARGTSGSQIFENKIVPANGLTKNDYTWVPLGSGGADSLGAFLAGTIDAYPSAEPYLSLGIKKGGGVLQVLEGEPGQGHGHRPGLPVRRRGADRGRRPEDLPRAPGPQAGSVAGGPRSVSQGDGRPAPGGW